MTQLGGSAPVEVAHALGVVYASGTCYNRFRTLLEFQDPRTASGRASVREVR